MTNLKPGEKCFLDGKQEVIIVKSFNKLSTKYVVETGDRSIVLVETKRLSPVVPQAVSVQPGPSIL